jgi:hypothetical protein
MKIHERLVLTFTDIKLPNSSLSNFVRCTEKGDFVYVNGIIELKTKKRKADFLSDVKLSEKRNVDFLVMDLETKIVDKENVPFCVGIYDGKIKTSFYLKFYIDSNEMLRDSIKYLMKRKYNNYKIYLHNFSHFDGVFLLRILASLNFKLNPVIRDGRIIDLKFHYFNDDNNKSKQYSLYFRDSMLLLPAKLRDLAVSFNVEKKGFYPYLFPGTVELDYIGPIPDFKYFDKKLKREDYTEYCKDFPDNK